MRITLEVDGVRQLDRSFNRVGDHVSDLRPVWDKIEREFYDIEREQFDTEGGAGASGAWKPLTRAYAKQKAQRHGAKPIMRASDRTYKSLTSKTGDTALIKEKQEFGIGTKLFYPVFHQRGSGNLPQREIISFSDKQKTRLSKEIQKGLLSIIKRDRQINLEVID